MGVRFPPGAQIKLGILFKFPRHSASILHNSAKLVREAFNLKFMAALIIFCLIFFVFFIFFVIQFYNIIFRGYAPFISTQPKVTEAVVKTLKELNIRDDPVVYELGCGRAGVLKAISLAYPQAELVGIEYSFLPYLLARLQKSLRANKIKIIKANLFKVRLWEANVIYCYLNEKMMAELEPRFKFDCRGGTIIISYQFPLPHFKPIKTVELKKNNRKKKKKRRTLPKNLYFYEI